MISNLIHKQEENLSRLAHLAHTQVQTHLGSILLKTSLVTTSGYLLYKAFLHLRSKHIIPNSQMTQILEKLGYQVNILGVIIFDQVIAEYREYQIRLRQNQAQGEENNPPEQSNEEVLKQLIKKYVYQKIYQIEFSRIKASVLANEGISFAQFETFFADRGSKMVKKLKEISQYNINHILDKFNKRNLVYPETWDSDKLYHLSLLHFKSIVLKSLKYLKTVLSAGKLMEMKQADFRQEFDRQRLDQTALTTLIQTDFVEYQKTEEGAEFSPKEHPLLYYHFAHHGMIWDAEVNRKVVELKKVVLKIQMILPLRCQEVIKHREELQLIYLQKMVKNIEVKFREKERLERIEKEEYEDAEGGFDGRAVEMQRRGEEYIARMEKKFISLQKRISVLEGAKGQQMMQQLLEKKREMEEVMMSVAEEKEKLKSLQNKYEGLQMKLRANEEKRRRNLRRKELNEEIVEGLKKIQEIQKKLAMIAKGGDGRSKEAGEGGEGGEDSDGSDSDEGYEDVKLFTLDWLCYVIENLETLEVSFEEIVELGNVVEEGLVDREDDEDF